MTLTLYTNPQSRGRTARWMLEEIGCAYDAVIVDWTAKPQALLDANPMGKVPTIVHDGRVVTEAAAVCAYLADAFPEAGLAPASLDERAPYHRWMQFCGGPAETAISLRALNLEPSPEQTMTVGWGNYDLVIEALDSAVAGKRYVAGDRFTAADVVVCALIDFGMGFGLLPDRPAFRDYCAGHADRPARRRAEDIDNALVPPQT